MVGQLNSTALPVVERNALTDQYPAGSGTTLEPRRQFKLVLLPKADAAAFRRFSQMNSKACPIIGMSRPGMVSLPFDRRCDIRTDAASYDVHSFGEHLDTRPEVRGIWQDDLVGFALGSAATLDPILRAHEIRVREPWSNQTPHYLTRFKATPVGSFSSNLVVSMRCIDRRDLDRLRALTAQHPEAHGAPVHVGDPALLGIANLSRPEWGLPIQIGPGEVPVFFASSLTAQQAAAAAPIALSITSTPGHKLLAANRAKYPAAVAA